MIKAVILGMVLFSATAYAQQPQEKFTLAVTAQQLNAIGRALPYLPKFEADPLIADLSKQVQEQQAAQAKASEEAAKKLGENK